MLTISSPALPGGSSSLSTGSSPPDTPDLINLSSLIEVIERHDTKVKDLFKAWDEDGNGKVSKQEFRKAIIALGFDASRERKLPPPPCCMHQAPFLLLRHLLEDARRHRG